MPAPAFRIERRRHEAGRLELRLGGTLGLAGAHRLWAELTADTGRPAGLLVNLADVEQLDGASAALLFQLRADLRARGVPTEIVGDRGDVSALLALYDDKECRRGDHEPPARIGTLQQVGDVTWLLLGELRGSMDYLGQVAAATGRALLRPASIHWADIGRLMERTGADALPIVTLIAFLIGLVSAFQSADTFKQYGANIYVADMVGLSITRVMGPLMTAILVTGRSGAGFAAELGSMRVSEEIDALRTLGLDPVRFLVIPRVLALVLMVPLLTLLADLVGIVGGMLIGVVALDLTVAAFLTELKSAVDLWDVGTGLIMSVAYALAIGLIACERGLSTSGGAEGVGRSTTSAVVTILFHLVLITSVLTILFQFWGI